MTDHEAVLARLAENTAFVKEIRDALVDIKGDDATITDRIAALTQKIADLEAQIANGPVPEDFTDIIAELEVQSAAIDELEALVSPPVVAPEPTPAPAPTFAPAAID